VFWWPRQDKFGIVNKNGLNIGSELGKARTNSSGASLCDSVCQEVGIKTCRQSQANQQSLLLQQWTCGLLADGESQDTVHWAGGTGDRQSGLLWRERKARRRWWPSRDRRSLLPATGLSTDNIAAACSYTKAVKSRNSHRSRRTMLNESRDVQAEREGSRCRGRIL
jgi:hypothetical protein